MRNSDLARVALAVLLLFFILPHVQSVWTGERASIAEVLSNPDKYDGQELTIQGKASKLKPTTSRKGNEYTTFTLIDESGKGIKVFSWGHPSVTERQKITVTGIYQKVKKVGRYTFYDEVEAREIK